MLTTAIVRRPCKNMVKGITSAGLGLPDYDCALQQHDDYIRALETCGLKVTVLEALEEFPDSVFVEDTAIVSSRFAVVSNPGAPERKGEAAEMEKTLTRLFTDIKSIKDPGTLEGGDVMKVGGRFYIGLSGRTNLAGAEQLISVLKTHNMIGLTIDLREVLHLKTGMSYLEDNNLLLAGEFLGRSEFKRYNILPVSGNESYAANSLRINDYVLVPKGFSTVKSMIVKCGYRIIEMDVSEFRKLDGGLSCLSLRY
jgi:dimethylargininase